MKYLILLSLIAAAYSQPHWDRTGHYRIIDTEPVERVKFELSRLKPPVYEYPYPYPDVSYPYPDESYRFGEIYPYRDVFYRILPGKVYRSLGRAIDPGFTPVAIPGYRPFYYDYKQVRDV